jgi:hypothetical protein
LNRPQKIRFHGLGHGMNTREGSALARRLCERNSISWLRKELSTFEKLGTIRERFSPAGGRKMAHLCNLANCLWYYYVIGIYKIAQKIRPSWQLAHTLGQISMSLFWTFSWAIYGPEDLFLFF